MFFIARCLFWLTIVFVNLPDGPRASLGDAGLLDIARAGAVNAAATQAAGSGAAWCKTNTDACAHAVLAAMGAKGSGRSVDTLTSADRAPRWQGAKG